MLCMHWIFFQNKITNHLDKIRNFNLKSLKLMYQVALFRSFVFSLYSRFRNPIEVRIQKLSDIICYMIPSIGMVGNEDNAKYFKKNCEVRNIAATKLKRFQYYLPIWSTFYHVISLLKQLFDGIMSNRDLPI